MKTNISPTPDYSEERMKKDYVEFCEEWRILTETPLEKEHQKMIIKYFISLFRSYREEIREEIQVMMVAAMENEELSLTVRAIASESLRELLSSPLLSNGETP